jgi:autotransporter adhesin
VAIGSSASAGFANSAAFGSGAVATRANQQAFGTAANTYTMAGITSAASKAAQTGPTQLVTSDAGGNLATTTLADLGLASTGDIAGINAQLATINGRIGDLYGRSDRAYNGIAMAFALAGVPTLLPGEKLAMTMNYGTFEGTSALALNAAFRLADNLQLTGGIGYGVDEHIAGGRVGLRIAW